MSIADDEKAMETERRLNAEWRNGIASVDSEDRYTESDRILCSFLGRMVIFRSDFRNFSDAVRRGDGFSEEGTSVVLPANRVLDGLEEEFLWTEFDVGVYRQGFGGTPSDITSMPMSRFLLYLSLAVVFHVRFVDSGLDSWESLCRAVVAYSRGAQLDKLDPDLVDALRRTRSGWTAEHRLVRPAVPHDAREDSADGTIATAERDLLDEWHHGISRLDPEHGLSEGERFLDDCLGRLAVSAERFALVIDALARGDGFDDGETDVVLPAALVRHGLVEDWLETRFRVEVRRRDFVTVHGYDLAYVDAIPMTRFLLHVHLAAVFHARFVDPALDVWSTLCRIRTACARGAQLAKLPPDAARAMRMIRTDWTSGYVPESST